MFSDRYAVDRTTETFSDVLLATGLAVLFHDVFELAATRIEAAGPGFLIRLERPLDERDLDDASFRSLLPYLLTTKNASGQPRTADALDYEQMKQRQNDYWAQRRGVDEQIRSAVSALPAQTDSGNAVNRANEIRVRWQRFWETEEGQTLQGGAPPLDWPVYQAINQMSAISAYNGAVQTWETTDEFFRETLSAALRAFAASPNDLAGAEAGWRAAVGKAPGVKLDITWSQVFNPASGKGQNRAKMDGAAMTNSSGFWLWEYLKFVGAKEVLAPRSIQSTDRTKDRKSYVLVPSSLDVAELRSVARAFHAALRSSTAVKMDITSVFALTLALLDHLPERFEPGHPWSLRNPAQAVRGLNTAYYKYLGTSAAVMNLAFLSVPAWMHITGLADIERYRAVLREHQLVVGRIEEDRSEGYELLRTYRDFLSEGSIWPLLSFCGGYGSYLISDWERPRAGRAPARQFSTTNLEEVFLGMDGSLGGIVGTAGFKEVAYAIRRSTVVPQYQKSRGQPMKYDIRYGLGAELMRKANYDEEFAAALAEFVQSYNAENAQKAETHPAPPFRRNLRTGDLAEVLELIDQHGAKLIGPLLVAFGYASDRVEPAQGAVEGVDTPEADDPDQSGT